MDLHRLMIEAGFAADEVFRDFTAVMAGRDAQKSSDAVAQSRQLGHGAPPGSGLGFAMLVGTRSAAEVA
jgi:hypothetical protein